MRKAKSKSRVPGGMAELSDDRVYGVPAPKPRKILPRPADITYDRVRDLVQKYDAQHQSKYWLSTTQVIDLMNGWDGDGSWKNKSLERARRKLQHYPGTNIHERPTSAQLTAVRKHLDKLAEEKLVEKERGHTDGNNSWGYRWISQAIVDRRAQVAAKGAEGRALARRLSLALGGDGDSGVHAFLTPDNTYGIRANLYGVTAERLLEAIAMAGVSPDFFTGKHWEILTPRGEVMGCTADREDVRREEPDALFRPVKIENCTSCGTPVRINPNDVGGAA